MGSYPKVAQYLWSFYDVNKYFGLSVDAWTPQNPFEEFVNTMEQSAICFEILDVFFGRGGLARRQNPLFPELKLLIPKKFKIIPETENTETEKVEADWGKPFITLGGAELFDQMEQWRYDPPSQQFHPSKSDVEQFTKDNVKLLDNVVLLEHVKVAGFKNGGTNTPLSEKSFLGKAEKIENASKWREGLGKKSSVKNLVQSCFCYVCIYVKEKVSGPVYIPEKDMDRDPELLYGLMADDMVSLIMSLIMFRSMVWYGRGL